ncbi:PREDICTED: juvenile hormone esterase-like [Papilio xuthus]|uniref:Juvenile hormone esterase-like n=1 Tax=Papilio xuthus TaxID=66420 RepID=A0AAJ6Z8K5_PAPXU|nr:PREDICTED: juvenile hormone esterase-like [Papilio xuthus]
MVQITIRQGILKGGEVKTDSGFEYYEFLGIPYAKPPVGDLRFKSPQPSEPWEIVRDASTANKTNIACQLDSKTYDIIGSEDCLYLNVYTPKLSIPDHILPVMIYIHGGGFCTGNGTIKTETGPDYLIENNVVIVTINYRLGVFGFLSLDIPEVAGNMGLKDIVIALEWVNQNIVYFNGDSNNVTVFGNNSGAAAIEYLMLSTRTKELFHKAILQSGSIINAWSLNKEPMKLLEIFLKNLNYEVDMSNKLEIYEFLMSLSAEELILANTKASSDIDSKKLSFGFVPIIENDYENQFLTRDPVKMIKEGKFNRIPLIKGFCSKEASLRNMLGNNSVKELSETKEITEYIPCSFNFNDHENCKDILQKVYFDDKALEHNKFEQAINFLSDLDFTSGVWISAKLMAKFGIPIYVYEFSYLGELNISQILKLNINGAGQCDDCSYLFPNQFNQLIENIDETDKLMIKRMTKFWTNFAKCSNPILPTTDIPLTWPLFSEEFPTYLNIDKKLNIKLDYETNKMAC